MPHRKTRPGAGTWGCPPNKPHKKRRHSNPWGNGSEENGSDNLSNFYDKYMSQKEKKQRNSAPSLPEPPQNEAYERYLAQMQQGVQNAPYSAPKPPKNVWTPPNHLQGNALQSKLGTKIGSADEEFGYTFQEKRQNQQQNHCCCQDTNYPEPNVNEHGGVGLAYRNPVLTSVLETPFLGGSAKWRKSGILDTLEDRLIFFTYRYEEKPNINSGMETIMHLLRFSGIMSELENLWKSAPKKVVGVDLYIIPYDIPPSDYESTTTYGETGTLFTPLGKSKEHFASVRNQLDFHYPQMPKSLMDEITENTFFKGKSCLVIRLNEKKVVEAAKSARMAREMAHTIIHEIYCHALDKKDGYDDISEIKEHEKFYNESFKDNNSPTYDKIKPKSIAGAYKQRLEKQSVTLYD